MEINCKTIDMIRLSANKRRRLVQTAVNGNSVESALSIFSTATQVA